MCAISPFQDDNFASGININNFGTKNTEMAKEIERKFLVIPDKWKQPGEKVFIKQAFLSENPDRSVRVRISGKKAFLTIKGGQKGMTRDEFNYPVPLPDAEELMGLAVNSVVEKFRYRINYGNKVWEVDEFTGVNQGLILAEVELVSESEKIQLPDWAGKEVTGDQRYYNLYLAKFPFGSWQRNSF